MYGTEALRPIREALEQVHERLGYAIERLKSFDEFRCMRWRCTECGYTKHFTRPMPEHVAPPCPKCDGKKFVAVS